MESIVTCRFCGLTQRVGERRQATAVDCSQCGAGLIKVRANSLQRTAAFSLAALILYVPANIYPILRMEYHGAYSESTVWDGCVKLFQGGQWPVAAIVFAASILIPFCKLLGLFFLVTTTKTESQRWQRERTLVHRFIELIGPWAMLDVFLLAVLVGVVRLSQLATILPGPGILAFTAVVVLTILASASFDSKLIWQNSPKPYDKNI